MKALLLFMLLFFPIFAQSEEIKAALHINTPDEVKVVRGYDFEFHLYPVGEKTIAELSELVSVGMFLKYFYIFEVLEKGFSPNNQEVFVVRGKILPVSPYRKNELIPLSFEGKNIYVDIKTAPPEPFEFAKEERKFTYVDIPKIRFYKWWEKVLMGLALSIVLIGLGYLTHFVYLKLSARRRRKKLKMVLIHNFSNASSRDDFERIYKNRDDWIAYLGGKNPETITFLKEVEDVQYKESWSDQEVVRIKTLTQELHKTIKD